MTVGVSERQTSEFSGGYVADSDFAFSFRLHDATMLEVVIRTNGGEPVAADPSDYSVALNADQYTSPGGTVTFTPEVLSTETLQIRSVLALQQQSDLTVSNTYTPRTVEDAVDYLLMCMQDLSRNSVDQLVAAAASAASSTASASEAAVSTASSAASASEAAVSAASSAASASEAAVSAAPAYSGAWAGRPEVSTLVDSDQIFITDFPIDGGIGSWFRPITAADIFSPLAGTMLAASSLAVVPTDGTATDQNVFGAFFPEGLLRNPYKIKINTILSKASGAIAGTYRVRIGTAGDNTDAVVHTIAIGVSIRSASLQSDIFIDLGDASVSVNPTTFGAVGGTTTVWPASVAIPNATTNALYVNVWFEPAGATVMTLQNATMLLVVL